MSDETLEQLGYRKGEEMVCVNPFTPNEYWIPASEAPSPPEVPKGMLLHIVEIDHEKRTVTFKGTIREGK